MDPCFDRKFGHILGGWWSKIEVIQVPGIYILVVSDSGKGVPH